jgi:hypothetical protein
VLLTHFFQGLKDGQGLSQSQRFANLSFNLSLVGKRDANGASATGASKEVVDKENAIDVIEVFGNHGKAAVSGVTNGFGHLFGGHGVGEKDHVNARGHDVAKFQFG